MEDAFDQGADVNGRSRQGETALIDACHFFTGEPWQSASILYLLKKGADPTVHGSDDSTHPDNEFDRASFGESSSGHAFDEKNQKNEPVLKDDAVRVERRHQGPLATRGASLGTRL